MTESLILPCSSCVTLNRVPAARMKDVPLCSGCGARLLSGEPAKLDDATFERFLGRSDLPILVDFWAPWCGPCLAMAPQFEKAAATLAGRALLAKVDTDQHPALSKRFGIQSIPTLILFARGVEVARRSGAMQEDQIVAWVSEHGGSTHAGNG